MKKYIAVIIIAIASLSSAKADEGMWTLYNLPDAVYAQMRAEGFTLDNNALYSAPHALKNSVVNFSGYCTGEVVSPMGLVMTNHHCGFESIRSHSTVEHDYMLNGFFAKELADELPNENMFVAFMKSQQDITDSLLQKGFYEMEEFQQDSLINAIEEQLSKEAKAIDSTYYVEINPFYEGNAFYATTYQSFQDIRLVFAPTKSLGKFGGETDNWMWPRQTCDFSVFRIYVDPVTGGPAKYSEKNVPMGTVIVNDTLRPCDHLQVSTEGYRDGDFAMVLGYPGSTERYLSSYGIEEMRNCVNDPMQQVRGVKQKVMKAHMDRSEEVRIKYDSKYAQSSNYWKNAIGMNKCIDSIGIVRMKQEMEQEIAARDTTVDFQKLAQLYAKRAEAMRAFTFFAETFTRRSNNELLTRATAYYKGMPLHGPANKPKKQYSQFADNSDTWDRDLDIEAMAEMMRNYREQVPQRYLPDFYKKVDEVFGGSYMAYLEKVWDTSMLMRKNYRIPAMLSKKQERDMGIEMSMSLVETMAEITETIDQVTDSIETMERLLCAAKLRLEQDKPHYSDANFTMRLTYGQVGGYSIGGYDSGYYTTAQSMIEKMAKGDEIEDYKTEQEMFPLMKGEEKEQPYGIFTDSVSKQLNLCFLTNNDITGGNSGSPVLDGKGRLIGLAFDGNWDSLSADIFFDRTLARCINVDIRYVLYIMKQWGHADRLLKEMGIE